MWPGPVVTLTGYNLKEHSLELELGQLSFPFVAALNDKKVLDLYEEQQISKPRKPLGVCTYAVTQDDKIVLTVRGERTNIYPGRLYGQGGQPKFTDVDILQEQVEEMETEILLTEKNYDRDNMRFLGLIEDQDELADKPDLIGYVPVNLESGDIKEKVYSRAINKRPNDVIGVVFAPATEGGLNDYLSNQTRPVQYCPPAHGGLVLYGNQKFGPEWTNDLMKKLE